MSQKSPTCVGKISGQPLTEYDSEEEAREGADYANKKYRNNLTPYTCDQCGKWHLSPMSRQTPSKKCKICTGVDGRAKDSYQSRKDAQRRADILLKEQGAILQVYECEYGSGWHLTKDSRS